MKQFEDWIQTAPVAPMRKFTCEDAMALAYEAGHQKGFNEGMQAGLLDAEEIAFPTGSVIGDYDEYNAGRNQAAEEIRDRFAGLTDDHCQDGHTVFCGVSGTIRDESE